jgi:hypothetical protein
MEPTDKKELRRSYIGTTRKTLSVVPTTAPLLSDSELSKSRALSDKSIEVRKQAMEDSHFEKGVVPSTMRKSVQLGLRLSGQLSPPDESSNTWLPGSPSSDSDQEDNKVSGRERSTITYGGVSVENSRKNTPPTIILPTADKKGSSWANLKREERLKNLRKFSISSPSLTTHPIGSPPDSGHSSSPEDKKRGKKSLTLRRSFVFF